MPSNKHHINHLKVEVDGIIDHGVEKELRLLIPEVINTCFDRFNDPGQTLYIDRITLDLGDVKSENLKEEFTVRLSYLIIAELEKIFKRSDFDAFIEKRVLSSTYDAIAHYLQAGFSRNRREDLSTLFKQLLTTEIDLLDQVFFKARESHDVKKRLFYQVPFSLLEKYWKLKYQEVYKKIKKVNETMFEDLGIYKNENLNSRLLKREIKSHTFEFMVSKQAGHTLRDYLIILKKKLKISKGQVSFPAKTVAIYFDDLARRLLIKRGQSTEYSREDDHYALLSYLLRESLPSNSKLRYWRKLLTKFSDLALSNLLEEVLEVGNYYKKREGVVKLFSLLERNRLESFLHWRSETYSDDLAKAFEQLLYFQKIVFTVFSIEIHQYGIIKMIDYLLMSLKSKSKLDGLSYYLSAIAVERRTAISEVIRILLKEINISFDIYAIQFKKKLKDYLNSKPINELNDLAINDSIEEYLGYLKTGVWSMQTSWPDHLLIHFLKHSKERLKISLNTVKDKSDVWHRLIKLHKTHLSMQLMELVFGHEETFQVLIDKLNTLKKQQKKEPIFAKILSAYLQVISSKGHTSEKVFEKHLIKQIEKESGLSEGQIFLKRKQGKAAKLSWEVNLKSAQTDQMRSYWQYLQTGVWLIADHTPSQILTTLIENSKEHLVLLLSRNLGSEVVWVRLIYQNPPDLAEKVLRLVFGDEELDSTFSLFENEGISVNEVSIHKKALELFILTQQGLSTGIDKSFDELILLELEAYRQFDIQPSTSLADHSLFEMIETYLMKGGKKVKPWNEKVVKEHMISLAHQYNHLLLDESILITKWQKVFESWKVKEVITFFQSLEGVNSFEQRNLFRLIEALPKKDISNFLDDQVLLKVLLFSHRNQQEEVARLLVDNWLIFKKEHADEVSRLLARKSFANHLTNYLAKEEWPEVPKQWDKKMFDQFTRAVSSLSKELKREGTLSELDFKSVVSALIPLAKSVDSLKRTFLLQVYRTQIAVGLVILSNQKDPYFKPLFIDLFHKELLSYIAYGSKGYLSAFKIKKIEHILLLIAAERSFRWQSLMGLDPLKLAEFFNLFTKDSLEQLSVETNFSLISKDVWASQIEVSKKRNQDDHQISLELEEEDEQGNNFSGLLLDYLTIGTFDLKSVFQDQSAFEKALITFVDSHETHIIFDQTKQVDLLNFIGKLSRKTRNILEGILIQRHVSNEYKEVFEQVFKENQAEKIKVRLITLAYLLKIKTINPQQYLAFLEDNIIAFNWPLLSVSDDYQKPLVGKRYVKAFIVYLQHDRFTYLPLERDGMTVAIRKVVSYWPDELTTQLRTNYFSKKDLSKLFQVGATSEQNAIFTKLTGINSAQIEYVSTQLADLESFDKVEMFSSWLSIRLYNLQKLTLDQVIERLGKSFLESAGEAGFDEHPPFFIAIKEDPLAVIKKTYHSHYNHYDLIKETILQGKFPYWSRINTSESFRFMFTQLVEKHPNKIDRLFQKYLRVTPHLEAFLSLLTLKAFLVFFQKFHPSAFGQLNRLTDQLEKKLDQIGDKKTIKHFIQVKYVQIFYQYGIMNDEVLANELIQSVRIYFSLSKENYDDLIDKSNDLGAGSSVLPTVEGIGEIPNLQQYKLALLEYLVREEKLPWWALRTKLYDQMKPQEVLQQVTLELLDHGADKFVEWVEKNAQPFSIYAKLIPLLSTRYFDRLVLALSPNFGGFMLSFNLLLLAWKEGSNENGWKLFIIKYLIEHPSFRVDDYLWAGLGYQANFYRMDLGKLQKSLRSKAQEMVKEGKLRFEPFVELLSTVFQPLEIDLGVDKKVFEEKQSVHPWPVQLALIHYLKTGALPFHASVQLSSYSKLIEAIEQIAYVEHNNFKFQVITVLSDKDTRNNLIKREREHFLWKILTVLIPSDLSRLFDLKVKALAIIHLKQPGFPQDALLIYFYATLFDQIVFWKGAKVSVDDLIIQMLIGFSDRMKVEPLFFSKEELAKHGFDQKFQHKFLARTEKTSTARKQQMLPPVPKIFEVKPNALLDQRTKVKMAGVVIFWPYLTRYFEMLEMLDGRNFKSVEDQIKAVQLIHYLATGEDEVPEHELVLSKVLCGVEIATPVPMQFDLTEKEKETTLMMMKGVLQNWEKLKGSSPEALREGFLVRDGLILEREKLWELEVEKKTIDILMESLPWSLATVKLPWMKKRLIVEWL